MSDHCKQPCSPSKSTTPPRNTASAPCKGLNQTPLNDGAQLMHRYFKRAESYFTGVIQSEPQDNHEHT